MTECISLQNFDYVAIFVYIALMAVIGFAFGWFVKDSSSFFKGGGLPKTVLYTLNPADNCAFATLSGSFSRGANIIRQTTMKRFGDASELLGCVNWLIDDKNAAFVTGITVPVDGIFLSCSGL